MPLLALVVGTLGFFYGSDRAQRELVGLVREIYPSATAQETRLVQQLVDGRAISLGLGVIGTLFASTAIYGTLDSAFATVLGQGGRRGFVRGNLHALGFIGAIGALAVLSFAVSYGAQAAQGALTAAGYRAQVRLALQLISPGLGLFAGFGFFYLIYHAVPRARIPPADIRWAALVSAVLWEIAKVAFGFFTRALGIFTAYGPIAFAAGLLTWVYLTAVIILVGVEVIKAQRRTTT